MRRPAAWGLSCLKAAPAPTPRTCKGHCKMSGTCLRGLTHASCKPGPVRGAWGPVSQRWGRCRAPLTAEVHPCILTCIMYLYLR